MSRLTNLSNARLDYIETTRRRIFEWRFLSDFVFRERRDEKCIVSFRFWIRVYGNGVMEDGMVVVIYR